MAPTSAQLISRHLHQLTARHGSSLPDHELVQRFILSRDERAFATLVDRHAAMVLNLCRSILRNHHDAEDIFQAVFLVLARKAGSIRKGESVGSWLHAVAYRMAHKSRVRDGKRRQREQQTATHEETPMDDVTWGELRGILHEEVNRLPEKCRAAIVLCYWEGRTHEQAAQQLGCARSTVKDRLERARELLRTRLGRRGLALPAAWLAASLSGGTSSAAVPTALAQATVRGAILFASGGLPAEIVSVQAIACARSALHAMLLGKLKFGILLAVMLGVLGGGTGLAVLQGPAAQVEPAAHPQPPAKNAAPPKPAHAGVDRRGDPLPPGAVARLGTMRFRHGDPVSSMILGADGKSIVSAAGKIVYVWDLATGKERMRLDGHENEVTSVACSPDGKLIAAGCRGGTIHLWDATAGRETRRFMAHKERDRTYLGSAAAWVCRFTPNGRQLVSTGGDLAIRLWDVASGTQVREFGGRIGLTQMALSPDGKTLAAFIGEDKAGEIKLWEVATGRELKRFAQPKGRATSIAFAPDGKTLAAAVGESDWKKPSEIKLWDVKSGRELRSLRGHKGWTNCLAFSPDGKTLAATSLLDITIHLWDVNAGAEVRPILNRQASIHELLFCPDGKRLVSWTPGDYALRFWNLASGEEAGSRGNALGPVGCVSFSPDGRLLASSSEDGILRLWDVGAKKDVRRFKHVHTPVAVLFSPDGRLLASACLLDSDVRIWEVSSGKELRRIKAVKDSAFFICMAWSGDGKMLATRNRADGLVHLWDADTSKELRQLHGGDTEINWLAFSPDGKILAAAGGVFGRGNKLLLWATDSGRLLHSLDAPDDLHDFHRAVFSLDGRTLAAGGRYGGSSSIYLWEVISGRRRLTLKHGEDVTSLAFSPDGKLLAAANNKTGSHITANGRSGIQDVGKWECPRVRLWDVATEKELPPFKGHQGSITSISFSPDGKLLATGSNDTTVLLWDATRLKTNGPASEKLSPEQIESLWADLAGTDAAKAYRAIRTLAADPKQSVASLKRRLKPVAAADAKQVARLLADLDSERFTVRDKAMRELEKLGESAAAELHKALANKPSLEVKRRIEQLLEKQNGPETLRTVRALETLERIGTHAARELCATLAAGAAEAWLTREARATLRRLTR